MRSSLNALNELVGTRLINVLEVGVCAGQNAEAIYKQFRVGKLFLLDWWQSSYSPERDKWIIDTMNRFENKRNVFIIRAESLSTAEIFPDSYFDYIYLDDNHNPEHVFSEMQVYWNKVKVGGMLAGHDYNQNNPERVMKAVNMFGKMMHVNIQFGQNEGEDVCDWWLFK